MLKKFPEGCNMVVKVLSQKELERYREEQRKKQKLEDDRLSKELQEAKERHEMEIRTIFPWYEPEKT